MMPPNRGGASHSSIHLHCPVTGWLIGWLIGWLVAVQVTNLGWAVHNVTARTNICMQVGGGWAACVCRW